MRVLIQSENRLFNIIEGLCKKEDISIYELCKQEGLRPGLFSDLKKKETASLSMDNLRTIADHFAIPMDVLFDRNCGNGDESNGF